MTGTRATRSLDAGVAPLGVEPLVGVDPRWWADYCETEAELVARDEALQRVELELCAKSRWYFLQRYYFTPDKFERRPVRLLPNAPQLLYDHNATLNDDILKSRKLGFSTWVVACMFHLCRFTPGRNGMVIAHTEKATAELFKKLKYAIKRLPAWLSPPLERDNTKEILFEHDSQILVGTAGSLDIGRGSDIDFLHLAELASFPNLGDTLAGAGEALTPIGRIVKESTAKGFNAWRDECMDALEGRNGARLHVFPWWGHPGNRLPLEEGERIEPDRDEAVLVKAHGLASEQIKFRRAKRAQLKTRFQQEHLENEVSCFLESGAPKFDQQILSRLLVAVGQRVKALDLEDAVPADCPWAGDLRTPDLTIWVPPIEPGACNCRRCGGLGHRYLVAADVAGGSGGDADYSYAEVFDITDKGGVEQVARYRSNEIRPGPFGRFLASLGWYYREALVAPEENNHGHATLYALQEEGYSELYYHLDVVTGKEWDRPGFPTNVGTRNQILDMLSECLIVGGMVIRDEIFLREALSFQIGDELEGMGTVTKERRKSVKRDGVIANAIGYYVAMRETS